MTRKWTCLLLLVLLYGFWLVPAAGAQKLTGELILQRGVVKVRRFGREQFFRTPGITVPLFENDVVQTGPNTRATLFLRLKKEQIQMYSNSHIRLEAVDAERTSIAMAIGKALFSVFRSPTYRTAFGVRTQTATIGVKGTKFVVGSEVDRSYVLGLEGFVGVVSVATPDIEVLITKDQALVAAKGLPLSPVVKVTEEEREAIIREEGLDTFRRLKVTLPEPPTLDDR